MNENELVNLAKNFPLVKELCVWLTTQSQSIKALGVSKAEESTGIDYYDLVAAFKELDKIGAGNFVVGRKGHDSRMVWKYDTISIGEVGSNGLSMLDSFTWNGFEKVPKNAIDLLEQPKAVVKVGGIRHSFNLRKNFQVELELPEDISEYELEKLKSWLNLLTY